MASESRTCDDAGRATNGALDNHHSVVDGPLRLVNELLCSASQNERRGLCTHAAREEVVAIRAELRRKGYRSGSSATGAATRQQPRNTTKPQTRR